MTCVPMLRWGCRMDGALYDYVHGYGATPEEALARLACDFAILWGNIAQEDDEALAPDARRLKRELLRVPAEIRDRLLALDKEAEDD